MRKQSSFIFFALLMLAALACGLPSLPREVAVPLDAAATAQAAAQAAATAAALASGQGESLIATLEAASMDLEINLGALSEKFANLQPDANGNVTIVLTDSEINQALQGQNTISQEGVTVEGLTVTFTGGNVVLVGNLTSPIQSQLTAAFTPLVVDGQLQFTLASATLGPFPVPAGILAPIEATLNESIGGLLNNLPQNYTLQSVSVGAGTLTIVIHVG